MPGWPALTLVCLTSEMCCEWFARVLLWHAQLYLYLFTEYLCRQRPEHEKWWRVQSSVPWIGAVCPLLYLFLSFLEGWHDKSSHSSDASRTFLRKSYQWIRHSGHSSFVLGLGDASAPAVKQQTLNQEPSNQLMAAKLICDFRSTSRLTLSPK